MKNKDIPLISLVTSADYDRSLVQYIADMERLIQPLDPWEAKTIAEMLSEDVYECWGVMSFKPTDCEKSGIDKQKLLKGEIAEKKMGDNIESNSIGVTSNGVDFSLVAYCLFSKVYEVGEILRIGTHPNFQRRGYAKGLLRLLIKSMPVKGLEKILLEVREDNIGAINLYKQMGFTVIHTRKGYYSTTDEDGVVQNCDALIMEYVHNKDI